MAISWPHWATSGSQGTWWSAAATTTTQDVMIYPNAVYVAPPPALPEEPAGPLDWLRRRVNEVCEAAAA